MLLQARTCLTLSLRSFSDARASSCNASCALLRRISGSLCAAARTQTTPHPRACHYLGACCLQQARMTARGARLSGTFVSNGCARYGDLQMAQCNIDSRSASPPPYAFAAATSTASSGKSSPASREVPQCTITPCSRITMPGPSGPCLVHTLPCCYVGLLRSKL